MYTSLGYLFKITYFTLILCLSCFLYNFYVLSWYEEHEFLFENLDRTTGVIGDLWQQEWLEFFLKYGEASLTVLIWSLNFPSCMILTIYWYFNWLTIDLGWIYVWTLYNFSELMLASRGTCFVGAKLYIFRVNPNQS